MGGRDLRDAERHGKHDRKHRGADDQAAGLSRDEKGERRRAISPPDPTYGFMMGSLIEHGNTVGSIRNDCAMSFMFEVKGCTCRYRMSYTDWAPLAVLYVGTLAVRKDMLVNQLGEGDLSEGEQRQIQIALKITNRRWGTNRSGNVNIEKRPLLTSQEWADIQLGEQVGLGCLHPMGTSDQLDCMEKLKILNHRRRPAHSITDELGKTSLTS